MTKKTRNFVLGAGAILAVGLTTGLVASLGLPVALSRAAGPDELEYVPAEAMAVGYANVREVMASELRQRLRKIEPDTHERDDFEAKTGVNIERDIDSVVGAVLPTAPATTGTTGRWSWPAAASTRCASRVWPGSTAARSPTTRACVC